MGKVACACDFLVLNVLNEKLVRMIKFLSIALIHDKDSISVDDRGQSVSYNDYSATLEDLLELLLNKVVSFQVDVGCGLI